MDWRHDAKCRGGRLNPEKFSAITPQGQAEAVRFCTGAKGKTACPVIEQCRDDAVRGGDITDVRGGMTPDELQAEARRRNGTTARAK